MRKARLFIHSFTQILWIIKSYGDKNNIWYFRERQVVIVLDLSITVGIILWNYTYRYQVFCSWSLSKSCFPNHMLNLSSYYIITINDKCLKHYLAFSSYHTLSIVLNSLCELSHLMSKWPCEGVLTILLISWRKLMSVDIKMTSQLISGESRTQKVFLTSWPSY